MGLVAAKILRVPVVATVHRTEVMPWNSSVRWWARWIFLNMCDRIIAVSNSTRALALSCGAPSRRITVIHNTVDESRFYPGRRADARQELGLDRDAFVLLTVGNLVKRKGVDLLINAAAALRDEIKKFLVIIIGQGEEHENLHSLIIRLGVKDIVLLMGRVSDEQLATYYHASDAFVLSSYHEGQSVALLEAMASGLPTIASNAPGNLETVEEGLTGFLFPLGSVTSLADSIRRIANDDNLRERLSVGAKSEYKSKFSAKSVLEAHSVVYQSVLQD